MPCMLAAMPEVVEYLDVLKSARTDGLASLYHNSGAFGFVEPPTIQTMGWIGEPDPSIRPEAMRFVHTLGRPVATNLTRSAVRVWREIVPGTVWVLPRSHWAYELSFGNAKWLPRALSGIGIDPNTLAPRNDGAAIEFAADEQPHFEHFLCELLTHLAGSDFALIYPGRPLLCTVHHHKQLWWTTPDETIYRAIERIVP